MSDQATAAFAEAVQQALAPHQSAYDLPANQPLRWSDAHWKTVENLGLPALLLPEEAGGAGASLPEAAAAIEALGALGDPSPAADTCVMAWLLSQQGQSVPSGPLSLANGGQLAWPAQTTGIDASGNPLSSGISESGALLNGVPTGRTTSGDDSGTADNRYLQGMAATRAVQIVGAASAALELTIDYVRQRSQFGRPLARFQAIQQHTAVAAAEVAAAAQVARAAFAQLGSAGPEPAGLPLVASAKITAGRAGTMAAKAAHQFHGAMGYTAEYPLHRLTRAIWQWREDYGNETWWSRALGRQVADQGADRLWPDMVGFGSGV